MNNEKKKTTNEKEELDDGLDGKKLHDLYRHTTKLIK
tara:strand:+ start:6147 stop:6257 length:111 start_codon:yes stop_codon:yes gene_type:complete